MNLIFKVRARRSVHTNDFVAQDFLPTQTTDPPDCRALAATCMLSKVMVSATSLFDKLPSRELKEHHLNSRYFKDTDPLTLMPFCQLREDHTSLLLPRVKYQREEVSGLRPHTPYLVRRHQGSSALSRSAFSELTKYFGELGRQIRWGDGLVYVSPGRGSRF